MFVIPRLQQPHTRILFDIDVADRSDVDLCARTSISLQPLANRESPVVGDLFAADFWCAIETFHQPRRFLNVMRRAVFVNPKSTETRNQQQHCCCDSALPRPED